MAEKSEVAERPKWQLPPDSWFRTQPEDRSVQDCIAEYYKAFPEHRPAPEVLKLQQQQPYWLREARLGNPGPLISQLQTGSELGPLERDYLIELLERDAGRRYYDRLREVEWFLIAAQVDRRVREGEKQESVICDVMEKRNCGRTTIFKALAAYRTKPNSD